MRVSQSRMVEYRGKTWMDSKCVLEAELFLAAGRKIRMISRVMPSFPA